MPSDHPFFFIDAFTDHRFGGNQAAVCLIDPPVSEEEHQRLAAEFNLSETSFLVPKNGDWKSASHFELRWFTTTVEMPLCGHATLAAAQAIFNGMENTSDKLTFDTLSGELTVTKVEDGFMQMDFPRYEAVSFKIPGIENSLSAHFEEVDPPNYVSEIIRCLIPENVKIFGVAYTPLAKKMIVALDSETSRDQIGNLLKEYSKMHSLHLEGDFIRGVIVTVAPKDSVKQGFTDSEGNPYDYICRFFDPWEGTNEDPATGSAQCSVGPIWSKLLGKKDLRVFQAFPGRGAEFLVSFRSEGRTLIKGKAVTVVSGNLHF